MANTRQRLTRIDKTTTRARKQADFELMHTSVDAGLKRELETLAKAEERSVSFIVRRLLREALKFRLERMEQVEKVS